MKRTYSLILLALLLSACIGDGEDSIPATFGVRFDLRGFNAIEVGESYSFDLSGEDNLENEWVGTISVTAKAIEVIDDVELIPVEALLSLSNISDDIPLSVVITTYYNLSSEPEYFIRTKTAGDQITEAIQCEAVSVFLLPDFVLVGDSGSTTTYICHLSDDPTESPFKTINGTWNVEDAFDGNAYLVFDTEEIELSTSQKTLETKQFKIDTAGRILAFELTTTEPSGVTLLLWSL